MKIGLDRHQFTGYIGWSPMKPHLEIDTVRRLRDLLKTQRLSAGSRLPPERVLAHDLGVSRAILRKALAVLEKEGRIWRHVGKGTFIGSPPVFEGPEINRVSANTNPAEIMEARLILEPKLASLAALRATKEDLEEMIRNLRNSKAARDAATFEKWDERLHMSIAKASDNSLLISLFLVIHRMRQSNIWGSLKVATVTGRRKETYYRQHRELVEALLERNGGKAAKLMHDHLQTVRRHLLEGIPSI